MSSLLAAATGNFTTAGTWGLVDSTSELDSEANSTAVSTSNLDSSTFTPGVVTVDGIALKLAARASSPSGTFTVTLRNSTGSVDVTSVTVNISDLPSSGLGWVFFKFGSSQLLLAATAYLVRVVCSATGSQVTLYRNATSNNWSRKLRTTTTQAPASGDQLVISNEFTGAGTSNALTVTMDNTATTSFGPTVSGGPPQGLVVSGGGTLTWGTTASTNYYLKLKGILLICGGGTMNGPGGSSSGTALDSTSTAILEFASVANVDSGLRVDLGGTWKSEGNHLGTTSTTLTADAAASQAVINVAANTGWANGDTLALPSTTQTFGQFESRIISSMSSLAITLTVNLTNAHHGTTSPFPCEVLNLSRNVKIRGVSTTLQGYIYCATTAVVAVNYVEIYQMGSGTTDKRGIDLYTTTGSASFTYCSIHDNTGVASSMGFVTTGAAWNNVTIDHCGFYNSHSTIFTSAVTTGTSWSFTNNICIACTQNNGTFAVVLNDCGGTVSGNTLASCSTYGFYLLETIDPAQGLNSTFVFDNNTTHSGPNEGFRFQNQTQNLTITGMKSWRHASGPVGFINSAMNISLVNPSFIGNSGGAFNTTTSMVNWVISGGTFASDTTFTQAQLFTLGASQFFYSLYFYNCSFDSAVAPLARMTNDFSSSGQGAVYQIYLVKCTFNPTNAIVNNFTSATVYFPFYDSWVRVQDYNGVAGDHRTITPIGNIQTDTVIFNAGSPSERLTPSKANAKLRSGVMRTAVTSGGNRTISVTVRKSVSGDAGGANYNGNQPRLIVKRNDAMGVTSDTVLASGTTSGWETLSGVIGSVSEDGVLEAYIDCDGTAGWINVDDWATA